MVRKLKALNELAYNDNISELPYELTYYISELPFWMTVQNLSTITTNIQGDLLRKELLWNFK